MRCRSVSFGPSVSLKWSRASNRANGRSHRGSCGKLVDVDVPAVPAMLEVVVHGGATQMGDPRAVDARASARHRLAGRGPAIRRRGVARPAIPRPRRPRGSPSRGRRRRTPRGRRPGSAEAVGRQQSPVCTSDGCRSSRRARWPGRRGRSPPSVTRNRQLAAQPHQPGHVVGDHHLCVVGSRQVVPRRTRAAMAGQH